MRVGLAVCAYNEGRYIAPFLRQVPSWVEKIAVMAGEIPWNGPASEKRHETWENAARVNDPRVEIIRLRWKNEEGQRNWGLGYFYGYDWVLILDPDEFFTSEDWEKLRRSMESAPPSCPVIRCTFETYWKDWDHVFEPPDTHMGTIAVRPSKTTFMDKRCPFLDVERRADIVCHHLSWVRSDEEVRQKIMNWSHANDFDRETWYAEVWKKWYHGMRNIHPYNRTEGQTTRERPLPGSIRDLLR